MSRRFVLAQISDMHIRAKPVEDAFDPSGDLRRALHAIGEFGADAIIATGDLANDAQEDEYRVLADILADAPAPLYLVPGNHDDAGFMRAHFSTHAYLPGEGPLSYAIDAHPVRIVAVDQVVYGETHGDFTPEHAAWLDAELSRDVGKQTVIALHHPPFPTHDQLLDRIGLAHAERFASVIAKHAHVGLIVCGHHHRPVLGRVAHAPVVVSPSTAWSFGLALNPDQPLAARSRELRGWALHVWSPEAGFASHFMTL